MKVVLLSNEDMECLPSPSISMGLGDLILDLISYLALIYQDI